MHVSRKYLTTDERADAIKAVQPHIPTFVPMHVYRRVCDENAQLTARVAELEAEVDRLHKVAAGFARQNAEILEGHWPATGGPAAWVLRPVIGEPDLCDRCGLPLDNDRRGIRGGAVCGACVRPGETTAD